MRGGEERAHIKCLTRARPPLYLARTDNTKRQFCKCRRRPERRAFLPCEGRRQAVSWGYITLRGEGRSGPRRQASFVREQLFPTFHDRSTCPARDRTRRRLAQPDRRAHAAESVNARQSQHFRTAPNGARARGKRTTDARPRTVRAYERSQLSKRPTRPTQLPQSVRVEWQNSRFVVKVAFFKLFLRKRLDFAFFLRYNGFATVKVSTFTAGSREDRASSAFGVRRCLWIP